MGNLIPTSIGPATWEYKGYTYYWGNTYTATDVQASYNHPMLTNRGGITGPLSSSTDMPTWLLDMYYK